MAKKTAPKTSGTDQAPNRSSASMERAAILWLLDQERIRTDRPGHTGNPLEVAIHIENLS